MIFTVEDISGELVEVELEKKNTCKLLQVIGDPVGKLLLLRNFSLEQRTSAFPPYALVCYDGKESIITTAQILSPQGKLGKPLWEQAKLHHDHHCLRSTAAERRSVLSSNPAGSSSRSSPTADIAPILAELKGAVTQQEEALVELQSLCSNLDSRLNGLESTGRKRRFPSFYQNDCLSILSF